MKDLFRFILIVIFIFSLIPLIYCIYKTPVINTLFLFLGLITISILGPKILNKLNKKIYLLESLTSETDKKFLKRYSNDRIIKLLAYIWIIVLILFYFFLSNKSE